MTSRTQQQRGETPNAPPANGSLLPGQLYVELADPVKLWAGVPPALLPAGVKLIYDSTSAGVALDKTGDTATGLINFNGGINVTNTPANVPLAPQDTNTLQAASTSYVLNQAETNPPLVDGAAAPGSRTRWSRGDHVHPTDPTRAPLLSPALTGSPTATTPPQDDNSTRISTTQYVIGQAATTPPLMDGNPTPGVATRWARADHVHPPDTTRGTVIVGDVPPSNPNPGSFWFDSVGVQLYIYYQDPTSTQWVPVNNQALAGFLALTGGNMQGPLGLVADPTTALGAATKQYADNAGRNNAGRNLADNAMFNIQQRGAGPWTATGYTADRWQLSIGVGDTDSVSIIALSDAQRAQIGDESAVYGLQNTFTGSGGANAYSAIVHKLEKVRRLAGKTITLSFWAASPTNLSLGLSGSQYFGSGGSPSPTVSIAPQTLTLSATLARYQVTFNVPSAAGKTLGTNGDDFTQFIFAMSAGSAQSAAWGVGVQSGTITLWGVQVEIGTQATPLEKLDPATDLARCQRFYQVGTAILQAGGYSGQAFTVSYTFPVTMRAAPTLYVPNWNATNLTGGTASTGANGNVSAYFGGVGASTAWCAFNAPFTASADL